MHVHRSNRVERLVEALVEVVRVPLADPFARECIVVQGRGMERWLSMQLARRLGVWANPDFPFPRRVIQDAIAGVLGEAGAPAPVFEPEAMRWAIAALLPAQLDRAVFAPIARYLDADRGARRRVALCARIAEVFDRYATYRPALLQRWERGDGDDWQAELWRLLVRRHGRGHLAARLEALHAGLALGRAGAGALASRVCLFGISTLPPSYVETFAALARDVEVHLFLLSPSREYWADIQTRRERLRELHRLASSGETAAWPDGSDGHPLLASLGRLGRDFQFVLESRVDYVESDRDLYDDPLAGAGAPTMLAALQSDLLRLRSPTAAGRIALDPRDESIRVHSCHGPLREAEVLHDQLTALFEDDETLAPHDVVVMTPAIDAYAPVIEAVFGAGDGPARIPYRLADRRVGLTSEVASAFDAVLDVLSGRLSAPEVLDLLRRESVRARFGIAGDDVEVVRRWVVESGVRWGADAADRRAAGQPELEQNTWRFGLDRLLLGYAAPGHDTTLFGAVLPYDDVEGGEAALLGKLAELVDTLVGLRGELAAPQAVPVWHERLARALDATVVRTPHNAHEHQRLRAALAAIAERAGAAAFTEPIALEALRAELDDELQRGAGAQGFLGGGVTFCELLPMRAIPFRVVCLMGMSDDAFPRRRRPVDFDLVARQPQIGDRSPRDDDRYLFLEAVLSARERLLITYVGQRITDNSELPPSVVVSELLDTLEQTCAPVPRAAAGAAPLGHQYSLALAPASAPAAAAAAEPAGGESAVRRQVVVRHPLQPFNPRYFRDPADPRLFSYAQSYCAGAAALAGERRPVPFVATPLPLPAALERRVDLDALANFFEHPSRAFLLRRLGLALGRELEPVAAREPLELDFLERWRVGDRLLAAALRGEPRAAAEAALAAGGTLPLGALGRGLTAGLRPEVDAVLQAAGPRPARREPLEIDADVAGTRITGVVRDLEDAGLVHIQFSRPRGKSEVRLWVRHLVLNCVAPSAWSRASMLIARPDSSDAAAVQVRFAAVEDAAARLAALLDLYWAGQEVPLPLFPRASRAYAELLADAPQDEAAALRGARDAYRKENPGGGPSEAEDEYVRQLYGPAAAIAEAAADTAPGFDPLDPAFELCPGWRGFAEVSLALFGPLLAHRTEAA